MDYEYDDQDQDVDQQQRGHLDQESGYVCAAVAKR